MLAAIGAHEDISHVLSIRSEYFTVMILRRGITGYLPGYTSLTRGFKFQIQMSNHEKSQGTGLIEFGFRPHLRFG